jgi:hypothetical protein
MFIPKYNTYTYVQYIGQVLVSQFSSKKKNILNGFLFGAELCFPQNSDVEILISVVQNVIVLGNKVSKQVIIVKLGHSVGLQTNLTGVFMRTGNLCTKGHICEEAACQPRREAEKKPAITFVLNFQLPEHEEVNLCCLTTQSVAFCYGLSNKLLPFVWRHCLSYKVLESKSKARDLLIRY